ncbi:PrpF protein [Amylostereum chailletii]|nr:PrpF protein [Amylostereum chailletii]
MLRQHIPRLLHPRRCSPSLHRALSSKAKPTSTSVDVPPSTPNPIPATFLRGGTSKGIFLNRAHLPADRAHWPRIFLGIMGSPDPEYGRQLNGMGGGVSSLSKICVVGPPSRREESDTADEETDVDVEYTFVQVGIRDGAIDYSGNCGNLSSMIGVFAVDEGLCAPRVDPDPSATNAPRNAGTVRAWNTNTRKRVDTTFPVDEAHLPALDAPQTRIAGVAGAGATITLDFMFPAGAGTGALLPTGRPTDSLELPKDSERSRADSSMPASLVDATNPTVFVWLPDVRDALGLAPNSAVDFADGETRALLEAVRRAGAVKMGLDPAAQAQPKIAVVSAPEDGDVEADIVVHAFSMGVLHKAVPMTVGLCLGVAAQIRGSYAVSLKRSRRRDCTRKERILLAIRHPGGVVEVGALFNEDEVVSAKVVRTGRRLMKGVVWW